MQIAISLPFLILDPVNLTELLVFDSLQKVTTATRLIHYHPQTQPDTSLESVWYAPNAWSTALFTFGIYAGPNANLQYTLDAS